MFKTKTEFINYIFSLQWKDDRDCYFIQPYPIGEYALSDLIGYINNLSKSECIALLADIHFRAEKLELEKLEKNYPQELFFDMYEAKLQGDELRMSIANNYPVADYVFQFIEDRYLLKGENKQNKTDDIVLPRELDTERARKYFKRCINEGWLTITNHRGQWALPGIRLAYVCGKIYLPPGRPYAAMMKFFNNLNLKAQITIAEEEEGKTVAVKLWKDEINKKIFFD